MSIVARVPTIKDTQEVVNATVSDAFELMNQSIVAYDSVGIAATLQVTFDGSTWEPVATSTAGTAWSRITLPESHKGMTNLGRVFRLVWASAFTGTLVVRGNNG